MSRIVNQEIIQNKFVVSLYKEMQVSEFNRCCSNSIKQCLLRTSSSRIYSCYFGVILELCLFHIFIWRTTTNTGNDNQDSKRINPIFHHLGSYPNRTFIFMSLILLPSFWGCSFIHLPRVLFCLPPSTTEKNKGNSKVSQFYL